MQLAANYIVFIVMAGFFLVTILLVVALLLLRRLGASGHLREEFLLNRKEASEQATALRGEVATVQNTHFTNLLTQQREENKTIGDKITALQKSNEEKLEQMRITVDEKLQSTLTQQQNSHEGIGKKITEMNESHLREQKASRDLLDQKIATLQKSNEEKLEQMRRTVDEQLQGTLEKRLGESFKQVSDRLEAVHKGLGEMQNLASGVGDLKRVLTNVKERGTWGEYQLEAILSEILAPGQYEKNFSPSRSRAVVEFAVRLPGKGEGDEAVYLPIDSKFPKEAYERIVEAASVADAEAVGEATKELKNAVIKMAKDIRDKYIHPPQTTDFAILFLPTEGLYAEVLRQPGLQDSIQRECRVIVVGPTTLSALLTSLRVGFQTLAIEKSASETRVLLGAVKTQFGKFGDILDKLKTQVGGVANTIEKSLQRTAIINKKLKNVAELPSEQSAMMLGFDASTQTSEDDDETETHQTTEN